MANLKRSKSIDCLLPVRSTEFTEFFSYEPKLKTVKSCPNIKMAVIQENGDVEGTEWKTMIPLMINSWVERKNVEIRKNQLKESCLDHLYTCPSPQMDMIMKFNKLLSKKLHLATEAFRTLECAVINEKIRLKLLKGEFNVSESLYNGLLLKNNELVKDIKDFENQINCTIDNEIVVFEKIINDNAMLKIEFENELKKYKLVYEELKSFQEIINEMTIFENNLIEERNAIIYILSCEFERTCLMKRHKLLFQEERFKKMKKSFNYKKGAY